MVTKLQTKSVPAVAEPSMVLSERGSVFDAPTGKPEEYVFRASSLSHSWPTVIAWVMAFVLASYVVVLDVAVWIAAAKKTPM